MPLIVQKFGGTSVADADRIRRAADRALEAHSSGRQVVMVVSARGKKTDELVRLAGEITNSPRPREMDMLLSTGEQESVALMAMAVHEKGGEAISLTGGQIGVLTNTTHTRARIVSISTKRMQDALAAGQIVIAAGFQGVDQDLNITTLGRGGSDTTAAALAAVMKADVCEIYTDVDGVYTTDPRVVSDARMVRQISYDEMLELASLGAGVMHSRSIEFAKKFGVPLRVRPSYSNGEGTWILPDPDDADRVVTGVAFVRAEALVSLAGLPDRPGTMHRLFERLSDGGLTVDMVVQNVGREGSANVSFTVPEEELSDVAEEVSAFLNELGSGEAEYRTGLSKVSAVGRGMQSHSGVAARMFQVLADAGINIDVVTTSEIKISVLIDADRCEDAVRTVHHAFGLHQEQGTAPPVGSADTSTDPADEIPAEELEDIVRRLQGMEDLVVADAYVDLQQCRLTLSGLTDGPGILSTIFTAVAEGGVMVDMIVQNASREGLANVSLTVPREDLERTLLLLREIADQTSGLSISYDDAMCKLSVVGIGLRSHTEVGARLFEALASEDINLQMINTSEIKLSVVIDEAAAEIAMNAVRTLFGLPSPSQPAV